MSEWVSGWGWGRALEPFSFTFLFLLFLFVSHKILRKPGRSKEPHNFEKLGNRCVVTDSANARKQIEPSLHGTQTLPQAESAGTEEQPPSTGTWHGEAAHPQASPPAPTPPESVPGEVGGSPCRGRNPVHSPPTSCLVGSQISTFQVGEWGTLL